MTKIFIFLNTFCYMSYCLNLKIQITKCYFFELIQKISSSGNVNFLTLLLVSLQSLSEETAHVAFRPERTKKLLH